MTPLTESDRASLLPALDGWVMVEDRDAITKRFVFADFNAAFGWMARVALVAEQLYHHPEWSNTYRTVDVTLSTHDANGLTRRDIEMAQRMDQFASGLVES